MLINDAKKDGILESIKDELIRVTNIKFRNTK